MKIKNLSALFFIALMAMLISTVTGFDPVVTGVSLTVASFVIPGVPGMSFMALTVEVWENDIVDNLFNDNQFALHAFNGDQFVLAGKVVHIPVAGAPTASKKNLTSFPQTAVHRTDTELTYAIDTYYAVPKQIQDIEKYELSYDKRQSVVGEDEKQLIDDAMTGLLYRWAPAAANVIETTGTASADDLIDETATGSRNLFTKAEFKKIAKKFATKNLNGKLKALLTATHYHQFFESLSEGEKTNFNNAADIVNGIVGRYMGIDIMVRASVLRYRKVADVWTVVDTLADDFAAAAGDSAASLFWEVNSVERAKGEIKVFEDNGNPLYYGDVFSAYIRLGGRIRRTAGVYAVVEKIAA